MQYFSIVSKSDDRAPRTCAMLQDATLQSAALKARQIIESDHLPHVDRRNHFSIRRSSRRETSLLQKFMATGTHDKTATYLPEDLDSLLSRRNSMLLSFFMALYMDPEKLKKRFEPQAAEKAAPPSGGGPSGSGGVTMSGSEVGGAVRSEEVDQTQADEATNDSTSVDHDPLKNTEVNEEVVGDDNQIDALEGILNGGGGSSGDEEMDLF